MNYSGKKRKIFCFIYKNLFQVIHVQRERFDFYTLFLKIKYCYRVKEIIRFSFYLHLSRFLSVIKFNSLSGFRIICLHISTRTLTPIFMKLKLES